MVDATKPGILYLVGTPIGNLEDITFRALRILREVDLIAAEDTRHTGKLLHHFQIQKPQISYHEHNLKQRGAELVAKLLQGENIALVTDAGTPGIADPGTAIVQSCIEAGITVVPIPGPSAAIAALSVAGLPTERFVFEGFLPSKGKPRRERLQAIATETRTIILYEAPHRLVQTLEDLGEHLDQQRHLVIARELTKLYEEFWRGSIAAAISHYQLQAKHIGEFTLIVAGKTQTAHRLSEEALKSELENLLKQGMSRSQATQHLAQEASLPRRQIYQLALTIPDPEPPSEGN
ncbi:MAG TPA: 16S rRNA (cytidine(1402)-2'-O)-methyltransferase [Oscillatoriaceae cyanobacterium M33_DOE_052]|uniref:Ribosomal RNA small subunit methyltransferase I n=1 Tax=Planktothricoides sp. SpSt-374 TaxID=2282167 RepID=A0A7C3VRR1_9CYAN|nr:16S rRNA (cytidine(1402)-2'-O)-methyltransferase [Oscillatoriaceae cyanobacterium M33_DOE_052]